MVDEGHESPVPPSGPKAPMQGKSNRRNKQNKHPTAQVDGTVSDSVTNPMSSPRSKKGPKQRHYSAAVANENGHAVHSHAANTRPVSVGGNMLPATPAKEQAYAGPTFQASPAPSSLPMPRFFSKSVPNVAAQLAGRQSLEQRLAGEKTPETEQSSPEPDVVAPSRETQQTPLDMFFKADRAEKQRSASMQSPEMQVKRAYPSTEPRNSFQQNGNGVFLQEMDGDNSMPSPRTVSHPHRPPQPLRVPSSDSGASRPQSSIDRDAANKSLSNFLHKTAASPSNPNPYSPSPRPNSNPRNPNNFYQTPSPFQRSTSGPSTPTPSAEQQSHYALHYGNRNLSPMFHAVRNGTPPARPSGLRREESVGEQSSSPFHSPRPQHQQQIDPNTFSRTYLDNTIRSSQQTISMPPMPLPNGITHTNQSNPASSAARNPIPFPSATATSHRSGSMPEPWEANTNGTRDDGARDPHTRKLEDDLKKALNINALSG